MHGFDDAAKPAIVQSRFEGLVRISPMRGASVEKTASWPAIAPAMAGMVGSAALDDGELEPVLGPLRSLFATFARRHVGGLGTRAATLRIGGSRRTT